LLVIFIGAGLLLDFSFLPYHFSSQKPIDEQKLTGLYSPDEKTGSYLEKTFQTEYIPPFLTHTKILGISTDRKRIEVDLANQRLYAFDGSTKIFDFPISSGLWGRTPTGEFKIWIKLRYTKMEGGNRLLGTYYNLPNVPYTMFFYNDQIPKYRGYGIHGTYWHNNFGHPMSHGCVNMKTEDVAQLYEWAGPDTNSKPSVRATEQNPGTRIIIYGTAPKS
jgi:lipoprotein-anchoring transpeptidase ErfK/SrfK